MTSASTLFFGVAVLFVILSFAVGYAIGVDEERLHWERWMRKRREERDGEEVAE